MGPAVSDIVVLHTTMDAKSADELLQRVEGALASSPEALVLSLSAVAIIEPFALVTFLRTIADAQARSRLVVITGQPHIRALLLGAKEFGAARLVSTRPAAMRALKIS